MSQHFLIITLFTSLSLSAFAQQNKDIQNEYKKFSKAQNSFFSGSVSKETFKTKLSELITKLDASYDRVKKIEAEHADMELSREGNQMAYDLEMLSPLQGLAKTALDAEACAEAVHDDKINQSKDEDAKEVTALIRKICS